MKINYDLHIHSALSPCADDDMTPANIVGMAKLNGMDAIAIADHNAIANVTYAMQAGEEYGVVVVPAMELQTAEDIHVLCLFPSLVALQGFYDAIDFTTLQNKKEIFGNQLIVDCDDNVVGEENTMLLMASGIAVEQVPELAELYGGIAIAAHIDRDENGMVAILGDVVEPYATVELSNSASNVEWYKTHYKVVLDSDAHTLDKIGCVGGQLDVQELSVQGILEALK